MQPWGRVLVPLQAKYIIISLSASAELKPPTHETQRAGPLEPVLGPLNTNSEGERKLPSTLILICGPIFCFQTIKPLPILSQRRAQTLGHESAVASFAWQSNKAIFLSFSQNSVAIFLFGTGGQKLGFGNTRIYMNYVYIFSNSTRVLQTEL